MGREATRSTRRKQAHPVYVPVTGGALVRMANETSTDSFKIAAPEISAKDTAILGQINNVKCPSGITLHATDTIEAHDLCAEWEMPAGVKIVLMLEGAIDVEFDSCRLSLGNSPQPRGHIWSSTKRTGVRRITRQGTHIRKIVLTLSPEWVSTLLGQEELPNDNLSRFVQTHKSYSEWQPSRHVVALAEQLINPQSAPTMLQNMLTDSKVIEIVREALSSIILPSQTAPQFEPLATKVQTKARQVRDYIESNFAQNPSLETMSRELGMSIGAMQAAFKAAYSRTIADFSREVRLQRARQAIEHDGISVGEAAYMAGYSSAANFSTAFRRLFGLSPGDVKY